MAQYKLLKVGVLDTTSGANIPPDIGNRHWQAFLTWQAAGGVPDPADPDPVSLTAAQQANNLLANDPAFRGLVKILATQFSMTPAALIAAIQAQA